MPITLLGGPPRSGKSHYGVKYRLMHFVKKGVVTVTDIAGLNISEIAKYAQISEDEARRLVIHVEPEFVKKSLQDKTFLYDPVQCPNSFVRPGQHLMLDEAWRYWPAGVKLNAVESEFFPYHGHYNDPETHNAIEITLLTQAKTQLAREIHPLIEAQYIFRKMKVTGKTNQFQVFIYDGNNRKATTNYQEKYDPLIFPLYKSANSGEAKDDFDKRRSIFNSKLFKYVLPAFAIIAPIALWFAISAIGDLTSGKAGKNAESTTVEAAPVNTSGASSSASSTTVPSAAPVISRAQTDWRIVASYRQGAALVVTVVDSTGRYRTLMPGSYSLGSADEIYVPVPPEGEAASPWSGKTATYTTPEVSKK